MAVKFTASASNTTGQNPFLAGKGQVENAKMVKNAKFGKAAKEEKRSPSSHRGKGVVAEETTTSKLCDTEAIEAATPTQGSELDLEAKAEADKKRHKSAIDGNDNDGTEADEKMAEVIKQQQKQEGEGENTDFTVLLEKERQKRRDVEDSMDELKSELGWQREALARATHSLSKVINSSLQTAERTDQVTIYIAKKKQEKARAFFEAYKSLQQLVIKEAEMVAISNNGPMLQITVAGPEHVRDAMQKVKDWEKRSGIEAAVFKGKTVLSQMLELPIRASFNAMLGIMKLDNRAAREAGLSTAWLDYDKKWSIVHSDRQIIRGVCSLDTLTSEVHINMEAFQESGANELVEGIKQFAARDRFGSLLELSFMRVDKFNGEAYGRQPRPKGGGKGKY